MVLTTKGKVAIVLVILAIVLAIVGVVYFVNRNSAPVPDDTTATVITLMQSYAYLL